MAKKKHERSPQDEADFHNYALNVLELRGWRKRALPGDSRGVLVPPTYRRKDVRSNPRVFWISVRKDGDGTDPVRANCGDMAFVVKTREQLYDAIRNLEARFDALDTHDRRIEFLREMGWGESGRDKHFFSRAKVDHNDYGAPSVNIKTELLAWDTEHEKWRSVSPSEFRAYVTRHGRGSFIYDEEKQKPTHKEQHEPVAKSEIEIVLEEQLARVKAALAGGM